MNAINLIGRITKDPEVKTTSSDKKVVNFSLAINRHRKDGEEDEVDFIDCVAWNKTAEIIGVYTKKGDRLGVTGRLQTRSYEDKDGNKRKIAEVLVNEIYLLGKTKTETRPEKAQNGTELALPFEL